MINLDDLKLQFLKLINKIEVLDIQRNRSLNKNKNIYILFLKNLGLGDMIMLSPLITLLKKKNFNKIIIVSHFPNIFDVNIERIDLKTFFFKIIFDRNSLVISPSINFIHSFLILFPINKMGFFSSSKFFSNIKNLEISYKFDPILDHFNTRLIPFLKLWIRPRMLSMNTQKYHKKRFHLLKI